MHGSNYFQARNSGKRKPSVLLDLPDLNKALVRGVQSDALSRATPKNAARISKLHRNIADKYSDWRYKLRSA